MPESVPGIHHVTAICADVQRTVEFYVGVLGLRFIKQTVNFDVPDTYHIYFGDRVGSPGTAMTFFGWPHLPRRPAGTGQVDSVAFAVPEPSLDFWMARLRELRVEAARGDRMGAGLIGFTDPDGIRLELVGRASDAGWSEWRDGPVPPEHQLRGFFAVSLAIAEAEPSVHFLTETLGFRELAGEGARLRFETGAGGPAAIVDVVVDPDGAKGEEATGTVHHVAWRALDDEHELAWRRTVAEAGVQVTPVIERKYFRSIYFREPGGVLFEIATDGPGFTVDEPAESLGSALQLPAQHEARRESLKVNLPSIAVPAIAGRSG